MVVSITKYTKYLFGFVVTALLASGFLQYAEASDTLQIPAFDVVTGLDDARSLVLRSDGQLMLTEAGTDRLIIYQTDLFEFENKKKELGALFQKNADTDMGKEDNTRTGTARDTLMATINQTYVPDLDQPDGLSLVMDTYAAVVSSGSGHVHLLDEDMGYMRSLVVPQWASGDRIFQPSDVTSNEFGELFVLDTRARRVYHFNANGGYLQYFELHDMHQPGRLVYHSESLFITDPGSGKIHVLTDNGRPLATIGTFPSLSRVRIIDGMIWVLSGEVVHLFTMAGEHAGNMRAGPSSQRIMDVTGFDNRVFLLTSGSLYFWTFE